MSGRGRFTRSSAQNQNYNQNAKTPYNARNTNTYSSPAYSTPIGYQQPKKPQQPASQPPVAVQQSTPQRPAAQQAQTQFVQQQPPQFKPQEQPVQQKVEVPVDPPKADPPSALLKPDEDVKMDDGEAGGEEDGKKKGRKWSRQNRPDFKIPRRIRKRRQNARLKNLLAPKNAMMVLHELHPELKMSIIEQPNAHNQTSYTVEIELDGKVFQGMGMSKMAAKQAGSEAALKAVLLKKLEENNSKLALQTPNKIEGGFDEDVSMADASAMKEGEDDQNSQNGGPKQGKHIPEDDVPWGSLASFALYKLFSEWQSQGFQLPATTGLQHVAATKVPQPTPAGPAPKKKIPDDANQKHPVLMLNQLRPGSQYVETREGMPPNLTFTYTVKVDDLVFKGVGNSKKEAKKQCAKHALEHLGVVYPE